MLNKSSNYTNPLRHHPSPPRRRVSELNNFLIYHNKAIGRGKKRSRAREKASRMILYKIFGVLSGRLRKNNTPQKILIVTTGSRGREKSLFNVDDDSSLFIVCCSRHKLFFFASTTTDDPSCTRATSRTSLTSLLAELNHTHTPHPSVVQWMWISFDGQAKNDDYYYDKTNLHSRSPSIKICEDFFFSDSRSVIIFGCSTSRCCCHVNS